MKDLGSLSSATTYLTTDLLRFLLGLKMKSNNFGQESSDSLLDPERTQEVVDEIVLPSREFWAGFCFATVLYLGCLVVFIIEFTVEPWKPSDRSCARQLSSYCRFFPCFLTLPKHLGAPKLKRDMLIGYVAPMIDAVEYEEITFANDFEQPSIYRGYPTYEREQAWKNLWDRMSSLSLLR